jgi:hypothetical protein
MPFLLRLSTLIRDHFGWTTSLIEREQTIRGQMARWSQTPSRREFLRLIDWWGDEATRLGVTMRLGWGARVEDLASEAPDLVVILDAAHPAKTVGIALLHLN